MSLLIAVELNLMTFKGLFQPELFYDCMKFKDLRGSSYLYSFAAIVGTYGTSTCVIQRSHTINMQVQRFIDPFILKGIFKSDCKIHYNYKMKKNLILSISYFQSCVGKLHRLRYCFKSLISMEKKSAY